MGRIGDRAEMEAFVRAVELGGFSPAARELRLSPSTLSKMVDRLERALGARLLLRSTRRLAPTPEGELFLARCRRILAEIADAETEVGRAREQPRGALAMHVGVGFAMHQVVEALPRFFRRYPEVQVNLRIEDARLDLVKEGLDISVRPAPADESFVVRKLFDFERIVCAAPAYIRRFGAPRTPAELAQHRCLAMSGTFSSEAWAFQGPEGLVRVKVQPFARVNNADAIFRLGLMGHGLIRINEFIGVEAMREGRLVRVMADYPSADGSQMLALYPHERHRLPRVAAMLDFLQESFGSRPWRKPDARLRSARASSATAARRPPAGSR